MPAVKDPRLRRHNGIGGYVRPPIEDLPEIFPRGRRCVRDDCITILNIYNPGPYCLLDTQRRRDAEAVS